MSALGDTLRVWVEVLDGEKLGWNALNMRIPLHGLAYVGGILLCCGCADSPSAVSPSAVSPTAATASAVSPSATTASKGSSPPSDASAKAESSLDAPSPGVPFKVIPRPPQAGPWIDVRGDCALDTDGVAWNLQASSTNGQLGPHWRSLGSFGKEADTVDCRGAAVCVRTQTGAVVCRDHHGGPIRTPDSTAANVAAKFPAKKISGACAIDADNTLRCGGQGSGLNVSIFTRFAEDLGSQAAVVDFASVVYGYANYLVAVNSDGSLTVFTVSAVAQELRQQQDTSLGHAVQVEGTAYGICILTRAGEIRCRRFRGAPFECDAAEFDCAPYAVVAPSKVIQFSGNGDHGCAVLDDGAVRCWSDEYRGRQHPTVDTGLRDVVQVSGNFQYLCARHRNGAMSCRPNADVYEDPTSGWTEYPRVPGLD